LPPRGGFFILDRQRASWLSPGCLPQPHIRLPEWQATLDLTKPLKVTADI